MEKNSSGQNIKSLCAPLPHLSCFGCCPPIRPAHYDPLDHASILKREFRENRKAIQERGLSPKPIVGYSCWALAFLGAQGKKVGCLLHPLQNGGTDFRHLIDYGNKCARETCRPAGFFHSLPQEGKRFWLELAAGFQSFFYSSRRANPLFHVLPWGSGVLEPLRFIARARDESATELLHRFPFLMCKEWNPQAVRFLFRLVIQAMISHHRLGEPLPPCEKHSFRPGQGEDQILQSACRRILKRCEDHRMYFSSTEDLFSSTMKTLPAGGVPTGFSPAGGSWGRGESQTYTHLLDAQEDLKDFLRLTLKWQKTSPNFALWVNENMALWAKEAVRAIEESS